jgi:hypothetical protein
MSLNLVVNYMEYEIIISSETPETLLEIIPKYWFLENETFKYHEDDIIINELNIEDTISKVLEFSYCLLQVTPCSICSSKSTVRINNRKHFNEEMENENIICDYCNMFSPNINKIEFVSGNLNYKLSLLNNEEYNVLVGIIHLKTKFLIYRHIFNNDIEDTTIWEIIKKLQKLGLIWIDRDCSWRIKSFNYNSKLNKILEDLDI